MILFYPYLTYTTIKNLTNKFSTLTNTLDYDFESINIENPLAKELAIKDFKKVYGGGYLGYSHVYNLGNVSYLINSENINSIENYIKSLKPELNLYLNEIPENITYSILPLLR